MTFTESIKTCFRKYFVFRGRAQRSEFWWWMLFTIVASVVLGILDSILFPPKVVNYENLETFSEMFWAGMAEERTPLGDIFSLVTFIPGIAVGCRRLHDIGRSGWWQLIPFVGVIPLVAGLVPFIMSEGDFSAFSIGLMILGGLVILGLYILLIVWWATDSNRTSNRFGSSPKYESVGDTFS